jgi:hypothetical protein
MTVQSTAPIVVTAAAALVLAVCGCGGSAAAGPAPKPVAGATATGTSARGALAERPSGAAVNCSTRSEARFPAASDPSNVVVGPLVLVGAAYTPPEVVRKFGGNKFPALVRVGYRVTVAVSSRTRRMAGLAYGDLPGGEVHLSDAQRVVTFTSCRRGGPSGSTAGGQPVTFWSGFILTASPRCVPLDVWVDDEPSPRRAMLRMGTRRCP